MIKKVLVVVGTRPNFIKITQLKKIAKTFSNFEIKIVHTGQHTDDKMSAIFFEQFQLDTPDFFLNIDGKTQASQLAQIILGLENIITDYKPSLVMVVGDVTSTLAGALAANKCGVKIAHLESGLRSNDRTMPEEINRILTDEITDLYFVTEQSGYDNLIAEGRKEKQVKFVGNTMIDTLVAFNQNIHSSAILQQLNVQAQQYVLVTMHRPATVDSLDGLQKMLSVFKHISEKYKIVFPAHPRTKQNIEKFGLAHDFAQLQITFCEPLDYFSFQKLVADSKFVLTDSGGIQEETTFLQVPCITLRPNTERPITATLGTNTLCDLNIENIFNLIRQIENSTYKKGAIPKLWDGKATERVIAELQNFIS
jgi:UDP-N-acetylglucosamine 2-epimerase (non-hydrolysing)